MIDIDTESLADELAAHLRDRGAGVALAYTALRLASERASDALTAERAAVRERHAAELAALDLAEAGGVTSQPDAPPPRRLSDEERAGVRRSLLAEMREHAGSASMPWTCGQCAAAVGLDGSVVSRELRALVASGDVVQLGHRRSARYEASDRDSAEDADESEGAA